MTHLSARQSPQIYCVSKEEQWKYSSATLASSSRHFLHTAYIVADNRTSHAECRLSSMCRSGSCSFYSYLDVFWE
jgi:hypothetical protein